MVEKLADLSLSSSSPSSSPNRVELLKEISEEQKFEVTYVDIEEVAKSGKMQCLVSWIKKEIAKIITWYTGSIVDCSSCSLLWGWCVPPKFHTLRSFFLTPLSSFTFILLCMIRWDCWRSPGVSCNQCSRISTNDDKVNEVKRPLIDFSLKAEDELSPDPCYWNNHCDVELSFSFL